MLEKVARALYKRNYQMLGDFSPSNWDGLSTEGQAEYTETAKAAIEAMREPTDYMGIQGLRANTSTGTAHCLSDEEQEAVNWTDHLAANPSQWMKPTWRAMIDAALDDS